MSKQYWWPLGSGDLYRPLTTLSLLFNYSILGNGADSSGYHIVNFLLHLGNAWLVFELALLVFKRAWPAFFTAAIWAVHPVGVESVTNIVGRADLLACMAILGGLILYARRVSKISRYQYAIALFAIATAGVFSKENAAVLLGFMLLWDLSFARSNIKQSWPFYLAAAAPLALLAWARHAVLSPLPADPQYIADNPLLGADFWTARLTAIKVIGLDLWLLIFPVGLSSDRSYNQIPLAHFADPALWIALSAVAAILIVIILRYRHDRIWFWCAGFFGIALLPTSNLVFPIGAMMAERFLYVPSIAAVTALVAFAYRQPNQRLVLGSLGAVALLLMLYTVLRNPNWDSDITLATADLKTAPQSARLHDMLALALFVKDAQHNIDRAIEEQEKSWQILSSLPPEHSSDRPPTYLGMYYLFKASAASADESRRLREKALPILVRAKAISQAAEKAYDDDQRAHGRSVEARIAFSQLYFTLGDLYRELGRYPEAVESLRYGRGIEPQALWAYDSLSSAYQATGDLKLAAVSLEQKALLDSSQPQTLAAISAIYQKIPDASCAFVQRNSSWQLNPACPRVKSDLCLAYADLAQAWEDSRKPDQVRDTTAAARILGCQ